MIDGLKIDIGELELRAHLLSRAAHYAGTGNPRRGAQFRAMAAHLVQGETYRLTMDEAARIELEQDE